MALAMMRYLVGHLERERLFCPMRLLVHSTHVTIDPPKYEALQFSINRRASRCVPHSATNIEDGVVCTRIQSDVIADDRGIGGLKECMLGYKREYLERDRVGIGKTHPQSYEEYEREGVKTHCGVAALNRLDGMGCF